MAKNDNKRYDVSVASTSGFSDGYSNVKIEITDEFIAIHQANGKITMYPIRNVARIVYNEHVK